MLAPRSVPTTLMVLAACAMPALRVDAQPQSQTHLETRGSESPAVVAGRDVTLNHGYSAVQVETLVAALTRPIVADAAEARRELGELQRRLGVTEGAALAMLR